MSDLVESLKPFRDLFNPSNISNYESSMGLIFSLEEQIRSLVKTPIFDSVDVKSYLDELNRIVDNGYVNKAFKELNTTSIKAMKTSRINEDYLISGIKLSLDELFEFAESHNIDTSIYKEKSNTIISKMSESIRDAKNYLLSLNQLNSYCMDLNRMSNDDILSDSCHIYFERIKHILKSENSPLNKNKQILSATSFIFSDDILGKAFLFYDIRNEIINKLHEKKIFNNAESYVQSNSNLSELQKVLFEKLTIKKIDFTTSQKISSVLLFKDGSIAFKKNNGNYESHTSGDLNLLLISDLQESAIDFLLRKKPQIAKFFKNKYKEDKDEFLAIINTISRFIENEPLVKAHLGTNYSTYIKDLFENKSIESIDDSFCMMADSHKFNQFAYSIVSNKYKHLYNEETLLILKEIYNEKISSEQLQNYIGKKIAAFKTSEDFNLNLQLFISKLSGFSPDKILDKNSDVGAKVVYSSDETIILETTSYDQMEELGSSSWCIVRDSYYYDDYTSDGNRQYIIYDFTKSGKDEKSMIGVTLSYDGTHRNSHIKNDDYISGNDIQKFTDLIILNQRNTFKSLNDELENRLFPNEKEQKKIKYK